MSCHREIANADGAPSTDTLAPLAPVATLPDYNWCVHFRDDAENRQPVLPCQLEHLRIEPPACRTGRNGVLAGSRRARAARSVTGRPTRDTACQQRELWSTPCSPYALTDRGPAGRHFELAPDEPGCLPGPALVDKAALTALALDHTWAAHRRKRRSAEKRDDPLTGA